MKQLDLYDSDTFEAISDRLNSLTSDSKASWGTMTVAQMCAHCAEVQEVTNGKPLEGTPFLVRMMGPLIRKMVVGPKLYAPSIRTHPQYIITGEHDFETEHARLKSAVQQMMDDGKAKAADGVHALFGRMSAHEKGWAMYKHLDHHLRQFGV